MKYLQAIPVLLIIVISLNKEIIAQSETLDLNGLNHFRLQTELFNSFDSLNVPANDLFSTLKKNNNETGYLLTKKTRAEWDSIKWNFDYKNLYSYDANNTLIEISSLLWDGVNWTNYDRVKNYYDSYLNLSEKYYWYWENSNQELMRKDIYTYDSFQNIVAINIHVLQLPSLTWKNLLKDEFIYDERSNLIRSSSYDSWEEGEWRIYKRVTSQYDFENNLTERLYEGLHYSVLVKSLKQNFSYNAKNLLVNKESFSWVEQEWKKGDRWTYTYDGNNLVWYTTQYWVDSTWANYEKINIKYNNFNKIIDSTSYWWDSTNWVDSWRKLIQYDNNQNRIEENSQHWDDSVWVNYSRYTYSYNPANDFPGTLAGYMLLINYPNPFNPSTTIQFQLLNTGFITLKVYNALGKEIATLVNEEKLIGIHVVEFDATDLASGVYYYRLQAGDFSETQKMIFLK